MLTTTKELRSRAKLAAIAQHFAGQKPDSPANTPEALVERVYSAPQKALIELDREIVRQDGLRGFIEIGWPTVERQGTYRGNWHIDAISEHLEAVSRGQIKRLIIMLPPRHMKSLSTSVFWPAYDWIDNSWRQFLFASYAQDLSTRDSVRSRRVIQSPWFQDRWGDRFKISTDQNVKTRYDNDRGGYRMSTSVDAKVTGFGGDIVAADDPHNARQAESATKRENTLGWWDEAMSSRLNDGKTGAFVIIMQRLHALDLVGHIMSTQSGDYTVLCTPARYEPDHPYHYFKDPRTVPGQLLWPEHMPEDALNRLEKAMGPYAAAGQLQQRPTAREGGYFKRHFFSRTRTAAADTKWVRSWDLAASEKKLIKSDPDYTASVKVGYSASRGRWIIGHAEHFREGAGEVRKRMLSRAKEDRFQHGYHRIVFPQDPGQAGKDQAQSLGRMMAGFTFECRPVTGGKVERATPAVAQSELGNVEILDDGSTEANGWISTFLEELCAFPTGGHDDLVDAFTSGFNALTSGTTGLIDYVDELLRDRRDAAETAVETGYRVVKHETTDMSLAVTPSVHHTPEPEIGGHLWQYLSWIRNAGSGATKDNLLSDFEPLGDMLWRDLMTSGFIRRDHHGILQLTGDGQIELKKQNPAAKAEGV